MFLEIFFLNVRALVTFPLFACMVVKELSSRSCTPVITLALAFMG